MFSRWLRFEDARWKKLAVVLSVVITGISVALFFRKDASPLWFWSRRSDDPFAQQVERRVGDQPPWIAPQAAPQLPMATASIAQPAVGESLPAYPSGQSNLGAVGSLLAPIEGVVDDVESGRYESDQPSDYGGSFGASSAEKRHRVQDGDTLTTLAVQYFGRADAYRLIYDYNRDVLRSPDLLPIGAELRIPPRGQPQTSVAASETTTELVPVPPRPGS